MRGDLCWCQGSLKKHYGICTGLGPDGEPWFVHATIDDGVVSTTRKGFAGKRPIHIEVRAEPDAAEVIVGKAWAQLGQPYRLFASNCEHVARLAATGRRESKQLQAGVTVGSIVGLVFLAIANENGTSIDHNGYRRGSDGRFASRR
jgi:hypothetical protein